MINSDNINIDLPPMRFHSKQERLVRLDMRQWLKENNVKYSDISYPGSGHSGYPDAFNMRKVDAVYFKLKFGL
jgi:hypothetical protein